MTYLVYLNHYDIRQCEAQYLSVFYETLGKQMIHKKFLQYENRIAVGMVGEGSDCYGFDDEISMDHDYGIGFSENSEHERGGFVAYTCRIAPNAPHQCRQKRRSR